MRWAPPGAAEADADDAVDPTPVPEAERIREHEAAIDAHAVEPRDAVWADAAQEKVASTLERVGAESGFEFLEVDCRTTSCVASVAWPSYAAAVRGWGAVLGLPYGVKCDHRIIVPEPSNAEARYEGKVIFDCTEDRRK